MPGPGEPSLLIEYNSHERRKRDSFIAAWCTTSCTSWQRESELNRRGYKLRMPARSNRSFNPAQIWEWTTPNVSLRIEICRRRASKIGELATMPPGKQSVPLFHEEKSSKNTASTWELPFETRSMLSRPPNRPPNVCFSL